jgi:MFS family permease
MLLPVAIAYITRILINQWLEYERGLSFGFLWVIICPILCIVGAVLAAPIVGLAFISARRAHHFAPALVLIGGIVLVPFLPLPPLPLPVFPEQEFFSAHRAEFEQVVNLARQDKLKCPINVGCDSLGRDLPAEYQHLSTRGFVWVAHKTPSDITVTFWPIDSYYPVVYFDVPDDRKLSWYSECQDGRWVRRLDEHWYLCVGED